MKEFRRKQLLERLDREGATVGERIPETVTIQGEEVALRAFVFETKRRETVPPEERERVQQAMRNLRRERVERRKLTETGDITYEEGQHHVERILGINRALNALGNLEPTNIENEEKQQETADQKRWFSFLKQVLGQESSSRSRRRP